MNLSDDPVNALRRRILERFGENWTYERAKALLEECERQSAALNAIENRNRITVRLPARAGRGR